MISRVALCLLGTVFFVFLQQCTAQGHFQNVALNRRCTQSSVHTSNSGTPDSACKRAVNDNTNGDYSPTGNCIHTGDRDYRPSWQVDLQQPFPIHHIVVWAREGFERRMTNCEIYVNDKFCYRFETAPRERNVTINCNTSLSGQVVRLNKTSYSGDVDNVLNVCEFQVYVCSDGYWGRECSTTCGQCNSGATCDRETGDCQTGCIPGRIPPLCVDECPEGEYLSGTDCERCGDGCAKGSCNNTSGQCSCRIGWLPPYCDECVSGLYLQSAECVNCSSGCLDTCNSTTGHCTCKPKWTGPSCDIEEMEANSDPQSAVPVAAIASGAAVGGVVVTAAIAAVIFFVFVRRRGRNTHDAPGRGTDVDGYVNTSSAKSPERETTTDDNYEDVSGVGTLNPSDRQDGSCTNSSIATSPTTTPTTTATPGATEYQNVGDNTVANYESLDVSTIGISSVYTVLKK